jgi:hypothetical protein
MFYASRAFIVKDKSFSTAKSFLIRSVVKCKFCEIWSHLRVGAWD